MHAPHRELQIVDIESGKIVDTIEVTGKPDSVVDRAMAGLLTRVPADRFFVRDTAATEDV